MGGYAARHVRVGVFPFWLTTTVGWACGSGGNAIVVIVIVVIIPVIVVIVSIIPIVRLGMADHRHAQVEVARQDRHRGEGEE